MTLSPAPVASRFSAFRAWPARALLGLVVLLGFAGIATAPITSSSETDTTVREHADMRLYDAVVDRVRAGENYYTVVATEHRARGYPLRPFVVVRPPVLAWLQASLPDRSSAVMVLVALVAASVTAWGLQLRQAGLAPAQVVIGAALILDGSATFLLPELLSLHESWSALLISLSLALYGCGYKRGALAPALLAVLIRELALPYPLAMAALAVARGQKREAAGWLGVVALAVVFLTWHAGQVAAVVGVADVASPGWTGLGGWPFSAEAMWLTGGLRIIPFPLAVFGIVIALLGWLSWARTPGLHGAFVLCGYAIGLTVFGRTNNFYWAFLTAPLLPLGLLFAPQALLDLARSAGLLRPVS